MSTETGGLLSLSPFTQKVNCTPRPRRTLALLLALLAPAAGAAPVYDPKIDADDRPQLEREVRPLLERGEEQLRALVPERNGLIFCGCPACDAGTQDGQMTWLGPGAPGSVQCKFCRTVYPNERFPETQTRVALNPRGESVTYTFFKDANGASYYFSAAADYARKSWAARATLALARLAHLTRDPAHVRKTVVMLDAFAEKYPGWCVMSDRAFTGEGPLDSHPVRPRPYYGGTWSRWFYYDVPVDLLLAYDLVRDAPDWDELSAREGIDVRARLERDVFRAAVEFVSGYKEYQSNRSPLLYRGLIIAGRVVGEPAWVHDGINRFRSFVRSQFFFDGMWREGSVSYHRATLHELTQIIDVAKGYSDPAGFRAAGGGERFDTLDLMAEFPFIRKVAQATTALTFPNGRVVPVHDTWASERRASLHPAAGPVRAARRPGADVEGDFEPATALLNAMEHAVLHRGTGANQMQARLHFAAGGGHKHQDLLSLILWAGGREVLSDIGYTHTAYRAWSRATPAHNTVVVNETEQTTRGDRCDLTLFGVVPGLIQTIEAAGAAAYPGITSDYRRQLVQIDLSDKQAYVVDVFRVAGGDRHDWFLHGSADEDQNVITSLPLAPVAGTLLGPDAAFRLPTHERENGEAGGRNVGYAFIRHLALGATADTWQATFQFRQAGNVNLRTTVLGQPDTTIVTGASPSIRRALEDDSKLDAFSRPVVIARRSGRDLNSAFIAVHEPFQAEPFIRRVERLNAREPRGPIALAITHDRGSDILVLTRDGTEQVEVFLPGGPRIRLRGRTGFVRLVDGRATAASLIGGTLLQCGDVNLAGPDLPSGRITGVTRRDGRFGLRMAESVSEAVVGGMILATLPDKTVHGYRVRGVESAGKGSLILLDDDPGFVLRDDEKVDFLYYPQRELTGECRYALQVTRHWIAGAARSGAGSP